MRSPACVIFSFCMPWRHSNQQYDAWLRRASHCASLGSCLPPLTSCSFVEAGILCASDLQWPGRIPRDACSLQRKHLASDPPSAPSGRISLCKFPDLLLQEGHMSCDRHCERSGARVSSESQHYGKRLGGKPEGLHDECWKQIKFLRAKATPSCPTLFPKASD